MDPEQDTLPGTNEDPGTLELETLRSHLWEAADILRGSIDAADYKNYIFGLLFLKRVNDRFEEETEELVEEDGIPEEIAKSDRDLHEEFWVPERARWVHITEQETDIGAALNKALAAIDDVSVATTSNVADAVGCEYRTAYDRLHRLENDDIVESEMVGNTLVWDRIAGE